MIYKVYHFSFLGYTDKYKVNCRIKPAFFRKTAGFIRQLYSNLTINRLCTLIYAPDIIRKNISCRFPVNTGSLQSKSAIYTCKAFLFHQLKYKNQAHLQSDHTFYLHHQLPKYIFH